MLLLCWVVDLSSGEVWEQTMRGGVMLDWVTATDPVFRQPGTEGAYKGSAYVRAV